MTKDRIRVSPRRALMAPFAALVFILVRPRLVAIAIIPLLLNLLLFTTILVAGNHFIARPVYMDIPTDNALQGLIQGLVRGFFFLVLLLTAAVVSYIVAIPISAPFCDKLSEETEYELFRKRKDLRAPSQTIWQGVHHAVPDALRRVMVVLPIILVIFVIGWLPCLGPMIAFPLAFVFNSLFLAIDGYSYAMDRRFIKFPEKWRFLKSNPDIWLPFGASLALLALIPCNAFWLPIVSSVGATQLYCERLRKTVDPPV